MNGPLDRTVLQWWCPLGLESMVHVLETLPNPLLVLGLPPTLGRHPCVSPRNVP